ncbi:hypothetical protein [Psychroserpens algicola]|uniref:WD40-like Beta Propeller Repeat n=1 Tax=Psychroserpens algicola TaxID=1719034 RepID=A0ABT0H5E1_9FLAO|nr:hypothetical protein [Psychroserpens algicola]MCK8479600.1 hypothetical protein [Psychroserpens algicola]
MIRSALLLFFITICSFSQSHKTNCVPFLESAVTQFPNVRDLAISQNGTQAVYSAQSVMGDVSALVSSEYNNTTWSAPEVLPFSGQYFDIEPFFSSDGLTLYFASNRPLDNTSVETKDFDIWYVTRPHLTGNWSEPQNMGAPINTEMNEFYPIITDSKNFYFTLDNTTLKRKDDIYISVYNNGTYETPKPLSDAINSDGYEFNAYISPDESLLIYSCYNRDDGLGSGDLYISFKQDNQQWSPAQNMGPVVNSDKMDYCPFVDMKTQTLYFTSKRNSTKTSFVKKLNITDLKEMFSIYENGLSRLYKVSISDILAKNKD